jgi:hypothetical protein
VQKLFCKINAIFFELLCGGLPFMREKANANPGGINSAMLRNS